VAVAGGQGVGDGLLGLSGGDLEDAEAEDRHLDAVVEGDGGDLDGHGGTFFCRMLGPVSWFGAGYPLGGEPSALTPRNPFSRACGCDGVSR
jgi:hypothetical protein